MSSVTTRNIVISGATSGIGRAFFDICRDNGDNVIPVVRDSCDASRLKVDRYICADYGNPEQVQDSFKAFDVPVDVFANFAGTMISKCFSEADIDPVRDIMNVNLISPMIAVGSLVKNYTDNSVVLLIGSQSAFKGSYDDFYATSKAGIHGFVGTVAPKLAPRTRIIELAPGITINTRMTANRAADDLKPARDRIPMQRFADPHEVATVGFRLISDEFSYMTGNTIDMNGGNVIR